MPRLPLKILFLDVDGVLNSRKTPQTDGWFINPFMALLVGRIVEQTGCKVVLSSSWRHSAEGRAMVRRKVVDLYDVTDDNQHGFRIAEIQDWLRWNPDITRYAILDDEIPDGTSPNYAMEKVRMLEESEESCFARLDVSNMAEVIYWMKKWGQPLPTDVEIYLKELGAVYYDGILTDFQGLS